MESPYEWKRCTHEGIGLPGCPTCDPDKHRVAARFEFMLGRERTENATLRAELAAVREATWREAQTLTATDLRAVAARYGLTVATTGDVFRACIAAINAASEAAAVDAKTLPLGQGDPEPMELPAAVDEAKATLSAQIDDALKRSEPLVKEALKLGRSISGADPTLAGVVIRAAQPERGATRCVHDTTPPEACEHCARVKRGATEPDYDAEMKLPMGKTCGDCVHVERCRMFGFTSSVSNTHCDFHPNRFVARSTGKVGGR